MENFQTIFRFTFWIDGWFYIIPSFFSISNEIWYLICGQNFCSIFHFSSVCPLFLFTFHVIFCFLSFDVGAILLLNAKSYPIEPWWLCMFIFLLSKQMNEFEYFDKERMTNTHQVNLVEKWNWRIHLQMIYNDLLCNQPKILDYALI